MQYFLSFIVRETHILENDVALDPIQHDRPIGSDVLGIHVHQFLRAIEARERFGKLAADVAHLHDRRDHETEKKCERKEFAQREITLYDLPATDPHDPGARQPEQKCR